jgi:hypothetical protein
MEMASVVDTILGYTNLISALTDHGTRSKSRHEMRTKRMAVYNTTFLTINPILKEASHLVYYPKLRRRWVFSIVPLLRMKRKS